MSVLASAARKLWRASSPSLVDVEQSQRDANPMLAARRATASGTNPDSKCPEPSSTFASLALDEMSANETMKCRTPPLTMQDDQLYRRATPPEKRSHGETPARNNIAESRCAAVTPASPKTPKTPRVLTDRRKIEGTNCLRNLSLPADCSPCEQTQLTSARPRKIPFIVVAPDGEMQVHPAAAQVLSRREEKTQSIRILSVFGGPRSGKSTLIERGFFALDLEPDDPDHIPGLGSRYDL